MYNQNRLSVRALFYFHSWRDNNRKTPLLTDDEPKNLNDLLSGLKPFSESVKSSQQNGVTVTTAATVKGGNSLRAFTDADFQYLQMKCAQHGIELEDNRPKSGALWVLQRDRNKHFVLTNLLIRYGFQFAEGKGFWLKGGSK